jgi:hypothetical protein
VRGLGLAAFTLVLAGCGSQPTIVPDMARSCSFLHNDEVNAVILGSDFGAQMQAAFDADLAASTPITLDEWERRPLADRLKEAAARAWHYWL